MSPPWLARALLRLLDEPAREVIAGDLEEEFRTRVLPRVGPRRARLWFWRQAALSIVARARRRPSGTTRKGARRRGS